MELLSLIAENFKRLRLVRVEPTGPVTPIIGRNGAGKTSVLDSLEAALGGAGASPAMPIRSGQTSARVTVDLDEITVTRKWSAKGSTLEITGKDGKKIASPQAMLDKLFGELSFDPLAFTRMKPGEQAETLARIAGIDLAAHERKRKVAFDERTAVNRDAKNARAQLAAMPNPADAPDDEVSIADVLRQISEANAHNTRVANARRDAESMGRNAIAAKTTADNAAKVPAAIEKTRFDRVAGIRQRIAELQADIETLSAQAEADVKAANDQAGVAAAEFVTRRDKYLQADEAAKAMPSVDVEPLQVQAESAEQTNAAVRAKKARQAKLIEATQLDTNAHILTGKLEKLDGDLSKAITSAALPIPGLSLASDGVSLDGIPFAQCSGAEKLRASVAIGFALNPKLRLMLIRDGSLLDSEGMQLLAEMAADAGAQILIERVEGNGETGVRIEDGEVAEECARVTVS